MKITQNKKAFTLVELIVVITILAILGTIAFISLQGYSADARDSVRISDISKIKTSLELFSLDSGKYPNPDNASIISYSGETLRTQGIFGDTPISILSKTLSKKPLDPLFNIEYLYSVTGTQREYELLAMYEGDSLTKLNLLNNTYAANYIPKISGTYNQVFVKTANFIFPTPSIITSLTGSFDMKNNINYIKSQVINGGLNIPSLNTSKIKSQTGTTDVKMSATGAVNSKSTDSDKISVINAVQNAYSGTIFASNPMYTGILSKVNDADKLILAENIILNNSTVISSQSNTNTPVVPSVEPGNDANTLILVQSNTTNGNTVVTNSAAGSSLAITNSSVKHSTLHPHFGTTSLSFNGGPYYLSLGSISTLGISSTDITIDFRFYPVSIPSGAVEWLLTDFNHQSGRSTSSFSFGYTPAKKVGIGFSGVNLTGTTSAELNMWHHVAGVKQGTKVKLYVDGIYNGEITIPSSTINNTTYSIRAGLGNYSGGVYAGEFLYTGFMDEIRISNVARRTGTGCVIGGQCFELRNQSYFSQ